MCGKACVELGATLNLSGTNPLCTLATRTHMNMNSIASHHSPWKSTRGTVRELMGAVAQHGILSLVMSENAAILSDVVQG